MSISISYASQRGEIWRWYWRTWRRSLWKIHCAVFAATASSASFEFFGGPPKGWPGFVLIGLIGVLPLAGFVLFPMLMFKPEVRTLTVAGLLALCSNRALRSLVDRVRVRRFVPFAATT